MKKTFTFYFAVWAVLAAAFNAVVFLTRPLIPGFGVLYDARFWVAWGFVMAAFLGNLACSYFTFKAKNLQKTFYRLPFAKLSWGVLIVMMIVGTARFLVPNCPAWIAAIACVLVCLFHVVAVLKTLFAARAVESVEDAAKEQTKFIKLLAIDAEGLVDRAANDEIKDVCKKVSEAARYSDPMSNDALASIEEQIKSLFRAFEDAVLEEDAELAKTISVELLALIGDRNRMCKAIK